MAQLSGQEIPRQGILGTGFFDYAPYIKELFKRHHLSETHLSGNYEPQGIYWARFYHAFLYSLERVFDPKNHHFMLRGLYSQELTLSKDPTPVNVSITKRSNLFSFLHAMLLLIGAHDIYNFYKTHPNHRLVAWGMIIGYGLFGGWLASIVMNLIKLVTEFPLKFSAELFGIIKDFMFPIPRLYEKPSSNAHKGNASPEWYQYIDWIRMCLLICTLGFSYFIPGLLQVALEAAYLLVRMVTSPIESAHAGFNSGYSPWASKFLGILSIVGSITLWTGLILVVAGPALAYLAPQLGISLASLSHAPGFFTAFSSPVMHFLTAHLGFAATPNLIGAVTLTTNVLAFLGLNELTRGIHALINAYLPKGNSLTHTTSNDDANSLLPRESMGLQHS